MSTSAIKDLMTIPDIFPSKNHKWIAVIEQELETAAKKGLWNTEVPICDTRKDITSDSFPIYDTTPAELAAWQSKVTAKISSLSEIYWYRSVEAGRRYEEILDAYINQLANLWNTKHTDLIAHVCIRGDCAEYIFEFYWSHDAEAEASPKKLKVNE